MQLRQLFPQMARWRTARWFILSGLALLLMATPAYAQLGIQTPSASPKPLNLPPQVERIGALETAPVNFENKTLFRVAAPAVLNREDPKGATLVEVRAEQIEDNLQQVIALDEAWDANDTRSYNTVFDPQSFRVEVATLNSQTVLLAIDAYRNQPVDLLTITDADARFYRLTILELTQRWQQQLEAELTQALEKRLPSAFASQISRSLKIAGGVAGVSLTLWLIQALLKRRAKVLETRQAKWVTQTIPAIPAKTPPIPRTQRLHFFVILQNQFTLERRQGLIAFMTWLLFWAQVLIWLGGTAWILSLFPYTASWSEALWSKPIALLGIGFISGLLNRLGDLLLTRFSQAWENSEFFTFEDSQRRDMRISTIASSVRGLKTFLVYVVSIAWGLSVLGVPTSSVLTLGAVAALAISLAAQSLIKDLVNGFLILCEDQYAIGDWIAIADNDGLVENMNLRITQIRNTEGRLITIPNSLISQVENLTRSWSRVDFRVTVAYQTDVKLVLSVLKQVAQQLYEDPDWQPFLLEPPQVLGIEQLSHAGMELRAWFDTKPLQQWRVAREFRLRLRLAFDQHDIEIGAPQQVLRHGKDPTTLETMLEDRLNGKSK